MIKKEPIEPDRIRKINGPFGWIPREFITNGYIRGFTKEELLLYFFLSVIGDSKGLSFYGDKSICEFLKIDPDALKRVRQGLEEKSYIRYQKPLYQVLPLPRINMWQKGDYT